MGRERENVSGERENGVGFKLRSTLVDFDRWSKSTLSIFGYCKWPYQHRDILRQCKQSNWHRGYFRKDVCFQQLFWHYNFDSNNTEVHHSVYAALFVWSYLIHSEPFPFCPIDATSTKELHGLVVNDINVNDSQKMFFFVESGFVMKLSKRWT